MENIKNFINENLHSRKKMSKYIYQYLDGDKRKELHNMSKTDILVAFDMLLDRLVDNRHVHDMLADVNELTEIRPNTWVDDRENYFYLTKMGFKRKGEI